MNIELRERTIAVGLFLEEIFKKYKLQKVGAFTYSNHYASIRVLEKQGFSMIEEDSIQSKYFEKNSPYDKR